MSPLLAFLAFVVRLARDVVYLRQLILSAECRGGITRFFRVFRGGVGENCLFVTGLAVLQPLSFRPEYRRSRDAVEKSVFERKGLYNHWTDFSTSLEMTEGEVSYARNDAHLSFLCVLCALCG
jgi:hypothetical protein